MNASDRGDWVRDPRESARDQSRASGEAASTPDDSHLVGLGAICDLRQISKDGRSASFSVSEFVRLNNGTLVALHQDLGFTVGWGHAPPYDASIMDVQTLDSIIDNVLTVVLPDDDDGEDDIAEAHPWEWLAHLARTHGIMVTAENLRGLPYEILFSEPVARVLAER